MKPIDISRLKPDAYSGDKAKLPKQIPIQNQEQKNAETGLDGDAPK